MRKVVLITGASSGLGLSHAVYLASKGYTVFGTSRDSSNIKREELESIYRRDHTKWKFTDKEKLQLKAVKSLIPKRIERQLPELLEKITFFSMDVTSNNSVQQAMNEIENTSKQLSGHGVDVLINNAGIGFFGSVEELSMKSWEQSFDVNLFGTIRVIKAVLPFMRERKSGQIINTSSLGGLISIPFQTHYSASKAALKIFTEGLRTELKPFSIKVSTILPGDINTNFNRNTLNLIQDEKSEIASTNIKKIIEAINISPESPYYQQAKNVWRVIIQNLVVSPPPISISKKVGQIIKAKNPRVNYRIGGFDQVLFLFLIRRFLTDRITNFAIEKYYGI